MKIYKFMAIFSLFFYIPLFSDNSTISPSIKELLVKIEKTPDQEKRVLMNQLKLELKNLNFKVRKKTINKVKESLKQIELNNKHQHSQNKPHKCNHQPKFRHLHQKNPHQHTPQEHNTDKGRR